MPLSIVTQNSNLAPEDYERPCCGENIYSAKRKKTMQNLSRAGNRNCGREPRELEKSLGLTDSDTQQWRVIHFGRNCERTHTAEVAIFTGEGVQSNIDCCVDCHQARQMKG